MSSSRLRLRALADEKPHNSSKGKGIILETPYKPGFVDDTDLETVKMAVDKEFSEISNAFYQTVERTADTITRIDKLEIGGETQYGELLAKIEEVDKVSKEGDVALASRVTTISAEVGENKSAITTESEARASADEVITKRVDTILGAMEGDLGPLVGQIQQDLQVLADTDGVLAKRIDTISAEYKTADDTIKASVQAETSARVSADQSLTTQINTAKSELEGNIASVSQTATTEIKKVDDKVVKVEAKWGVSTNVNGKVTGISLNNDGKTGSFEVVADRFTISDGTSNTIPPFEVVGGNTRIKSAFINTLQSDNWDGGANGWAILRGGDAYFNNVTVRGNVDAKTFTGVGGSASLGGASYGGQQTGTSEYAINSFSVPNNTNEVIQCAIMMFGLELSGNIDVIFKVTNRTTGAYSSRRIRNNLAGGEYITTTALGSVDIPANTTHSVQFSVQKVAGTGWWSAPDGYAYKTLHRKFS